MSGPFVIEVDMRSLLLVATLAGAGCTAAGMRYRVTTDAIELSPQLRLCIAVDPADPHGVWWWQPGASGCATRSTGPAVFPADGATVSRSTESDVITVAFRLPLISRRPDSFLDVRLVVEDNRMRTLDYRAAVPVHRRGDLDVPAEPPRPR